jgi:hypothetical protein
LAVEATLQAQALGVAAPRAPCAQPLLLVLLLLLLLPLRLLLVRLFSLG